MELERKVLLCNRLGLHVRVCIKIVEVARKFKSEVSITYNNETVDGKDILSVLTLGAAKGALLTLKAVGHDAQEAIDGLEKILRAHEDKFLPDL